tara:strand:- start:1629 stop:1901 length:273 start_codon:yes stop_codon:yes gene_type:complete
MFPFLYIFGGDPVSKHGWLKYSLQSSLFWIIALFGYPLIFHWDEVTSNGFLVIIGFMFCIVWANILTIYFHEIVWGGVVKSPAWIKKRRF